MKLENNDKLIQVYWQEMIMILFYPPQKENVQRFSVTDIRVFSGRTSMGVRGIKLQK